MGQKRRCCRDSDGSACHRGRQRGENSGRQRRACAGVFMRSAYSEAEGLRAKRQNTAAGAIARSAMPQARCPSMPYGGGAILEHAAAASRGRHCLFWSQSSDQAHDIERKEPRCEWTNWQNDSLFSFGWGGRELADCVLLACLHAVVRCKMQASMHDTRMHARTRARMRDTLDTGIACAIPDKDLTTDQPAHSLNATGTPGCEHVCTQARNTCCLSLLLSLSLSLSCCLSLSLSLSLSLYGAGALIWRGMHACTCGGAARHLP